MDLVQVFRESQELKRFIYQRCKDYKIPLRYLCEEAGIKYDNFMDQYINVVGHSKIEVTDQMVQDLLETLGMSVRFQFIVNEDLDMENISYELERKYQARADKQRARSYENKRNTPGSGQSDNSPE